MACELGCAADTPAGWEASAGTRWEPPSSGRWSGQTSREARPALQMADMSDINEREPLGCAPFVRDGVRSSGQTQREAALR
jgi:hypothetical protein